jgi:hypothetical protein
MAHHQEKGKEQAELQDPRRAGPKPEFREQKLQNPPGKDSKMKPLADHGEESYVGYGRLKGRKVLITGGDSGIGRATAIAMAREGADVAIVYLPEEESDANETKKWVEKEGQKCLKLAVDITSESNCKALAQKNAASFRRTRHSRE